MKEKNSKKWFYIFLFSFIACIVITSGITVIIDPYFHFHKPTPGISYRIYEERYTNDGIARHFDYDTIITGTSMTQNFKPSEWDALTGHMTVKLPFSGGSFQEIGNTLKRAMNYNDRLTTIIWGIDYDSLIRPYDYDGYGDYPEYLYDDNLFNDVSYVFNKSIFYHGCMTNITWTLLGTDSTTMDEYSSWDLGYGMDAILRSYHRSDEIKEMQAGLTEEEKEMVTENIQKNFVDMANENPEITFYLFYTPYSIVYWDEQQREGTMLKQFEAEQIATSLLLTCPNIKLYSYINDYELICNTNNYKDKGHYIAKVNSWLLEWMEQGKGLVKEDTYRDQIEDNKKFYMNYDYDNVFEKGSSIEQ